MDPGGDVPEQREPELVVGRKDGRRGIEPEEAVDGALGFRHALDDLVQGEARITTDLGQDRIALVDQRLQEEVASGEALLE